MRLWKGSQHTYLLLERLLPIQHLSQSLKDLNTQLFLFLHQFLGVFDKPERKYSIIFNNNLVI